MIYRIEFKPRSIKDLQGIPQADVKRILEKVEALQNNLSGDVKRLTNFLPEYRLRVGSYRVLFETDGDKVVIYRIMHRRDVYN
ncbi:MAG: plasmid stabilization protein [Nitrospinae bacterium RIFCSPLOWO2_12_FULL_47_7]|nr:MAG: plasmid stabilization protein [Nitrospinae bacterium RIFCSPLOWO2_12_FULL_47_7]